MMQRDNTDLCFTPLAPQQVPALAALCADAPDPWTAAQLAAELAKPQSRVFVASRGQTPVAFAAFALAGDTAELEQLAVEARLGPLDDAGVALGERRAVGGLREGHR